MEMKIAAKHTRAHGLVDPYAEDVVIVGFVGLSPGTRANAYAVVVFDDGGVAYTALKRLTVTDPEVMKFFKGRDEDD